MLYGANSLTSINHVSGVSKITRDMVDRGDRVQRVLRIYKSLAPSKTNISQHLDSLKISWVSSRISFHVIRELTAPDEGDRDGSWKAVLQVADQVIIPVGACLVRCGAAQCWLQVELWDCYCWEQQAILLLYTHWQNHAFGGACSKRVESANFLRMGSSKFLSARKSCARVSMALLAGITSLELTAVFNIMD